ncbi:MAG TPA: response regulator [Chloroflexaceae bacterium]|nr:response regulator [Chloroflexaceae bacterium]
MYTKQDHQREAPPAEILIVDDHREITDLVADALLDEGYRVRVAHDGLAALRELRRRRPDLLLLDVAMPVMSGDQLLARLRREGGDHLPVILMTADRTPERFRALGADKILRKPFDLGALLQLVAGCTTRRHLSGGGQWRSHEHEARL